MRLLAQLVIAPLHLNQRKAPDGFRGQLDIEAYDNFSLDVAETRRAVPVQVREPQVKKENLGTAVSQTTMNREEV